jgi:hypothetical protein
MKCKSVWHTWFAKREKEEVEEEDFFFQWLASERRPRCRYKKYIFIACSNAARSISLVRARYARPAQNAFFVKVSPQLRVSVHFSPVFSHHRRKELSREAEEREIQKNNERKTSLSRESVFKKHHHDL